MPASLHLHSDSLDDTNRLAKHGDRPLPPPDRSDTDIGAQPSRGRASFRLNRPVRLQAQGYPPVLLSTQVHDQAVPVGYGVGVPVEALQGY